MVDRVWYVAYGSNLCRERLARYLDRPPHHDRPVRVAHDLYFAGESRVWTGGIAFLDHPRRRRAATLGRAWLLDGDQFASLLAAESARDHARVDARGLRRGRRRSIGPGKYDTLLGLGRRRGVPVVTFTGPAPRSAVATNRPAEAYLATIAEGLGEAHGLSRAEAAAYLARHAGITDADVAFLR